MSSALRVADMIHSSWRKTEGNPEKEKKMPIAPCRGREARGIEDRNRTDIYIATPFPFPSLATKPSSARISTMGRRKIEIQPITVRSLALAPRSHTHILFFSPAREEQIRHFPKGLSLSSTRCSHLTLAFQRKNGLFKKAYELGVLCSVDVAVIVFDNKQGGPRLYQYGSDDVITIVERAMRVRPTAHPPLSR